MMADLIPILTEGVAWVATVLSVIGLLGVSHKRAWGQLVWIVSNVLWVAYFVHAAIYPSVALFSVYLGVSITAYRRWRREEDEREKRDACVRATAVESLLDHLAKKEEE